MIELPLKSLVLTGSWLDASVSLLELLYSGMWFTAGSLTTGVLLIVVSMGLSLDDVVITSPISLENARERYYSWREMSWWVSNERSMSCVTSFFNAKTLFSQHLL